MVGLIGQKFIRSYKTKAESLLTSETIVDASEEAEERENKDGESSLTAIIRRGPRFL